MGIVLQRKRSSGKEIIESATIQKLTSIQLSMLFFVYFAAAVPGQHAHFEWANVYLSF